MSNGSNEILREIPHLSDAELHVYRYILAHARDIPSISVHTLAALTNTSTATILRLCRKYGCRTFPEFKLCLEEELACQPDADLREYGSGSHNLSYFFSRTLNDPSFDDSLNKAAELLGFSAKGVKGNKDAFFSEFPLPCIAHVIVYGQLLHYVVIHKITRKHVIIADPGAGIVKLRPEEFFGEVHEEGKP